MQDEDPGARDSLMRWAGTRSCNAGRHCHELARNHTMANLEKHPAVVAYYSQRAGGGAEGQGVDFGRRVQGADRAALDAYGECESRTQEWSWSGCSVSWSGRSVSCNGGEVFSTRIPSESAPVRSVFTHIERGKGEEGDRSAPADAGKRALDVLSG